MARDRVLPRKYTLLRVLGLPTRIFVRKLRGLFADNENALFFTAVCLVGALGGLAGAAFRWLVQVAMAGFWGRSGELLQVASSAPWWARLVVPIMGAALAGALAVLFATRRDDQGGFPDILEIVSLGGRMIRLTPSIKRSLVSLMTLASGGSVGREGPMGQLAAALGSRVGRSFRFSEERIRILVAAGIAAGFAAAYNTPIGATLFVLEVIIGSFNMVFFGPAVVAAAISTLVTRVFAGPGPIYAPGAQYALVSAWEVGPYLVLGFLAGLASVLFQVTMEGTYRIWDRLKLPPLARAPLGGFCVGAMAVFWPYVLGNGYETINLVLAGRVALGLMAILFVMKMLATTVTLASGGAGGVFTSTMFIGAVLGGVFGALTHELAPVHTATSGAYALAGMGGIIAGTTHAPFLAIIMVFELTQNYGIVLPLMLTSITAYWTARSIRRTSIYTEELKRRGMRWEGTAQERLLRSLTVRDIMLTDVTLYPATLPLEKVVDVFQNTRALQIYVGDDEGRLLGIVELHEVKRMMGEEPAPFVIADDLYTEIPVVTPGDSLVEVNEKLWFRDLGQLPVVDDDETRKFLGIVTRRDVLGAFDREVLRRNRLLAKVRSVEGTGFDYFELPEESRMSKVTVPPGLVGKTIAEAGIGSRHGITVMAIERMDAAGREHRIAPRPDTRLARGDALVVLGADSAVERFEAERRGTPG
ncbi:MAG TPA: chloride channel protein [Gemmatimonadota bacterium]|nr:chloride channel protein [Gemmatimonadota bacterium]